MIFFRFFSFAIALLSLPSIWPFQTSLVRTSNCMRCRVWNEETRESGVRVCWWVSDFEVNRNRWQDVTVLPRCAIFDGWCAFGWGEQRKNQNFASKSARKRRKGQSLHQKVPGTVREDKITSNLGWKTKNFLQKALGTVRKIKVAPKWTEEGENLFQKVLGTAWKLQFTRNVIGKAKTSSRCTRNSGKVKSN